MRVKCGDHRLPLAPLVPPVSVDGVVVEFPDDEEGGPITTNTVPLPGSNVSTTWGGQKKGRRREGGGGEQWIESGMKYSWIHIITTPVTTSRMNSIIH